MVEQRPAKLNVAGSIPAPVSQPGKHKAESSSDKVQRSKLRFSKRNYQRPKRAQPVGADVRSKTLRFWFAHPWRGSQQAGIGPVSFYVKEEWK